MSRTVAYSRLHAAFLDASKAFDAQPMTARIALAVHERGGEATSHELQADLDCEGSAVRRALRGMYADGLADGIGADGGPRRPWTMTQVRLTERGRMMVALVVTGLAEAEELAG